MNIGLNLQKFLLINRITISEVIQKTGISRGGINNIIKGKTSPSVETLQKIADAFEIPIYTYFYRTWYS
jgi:transcriptional regulator with XRE-family HTH domain